MAIAFIMHAIILIKMMYSTFEWTALERVLRLRIDAVFFD